jgi:hypothetical protein
MPLTVTRLDRDKMKAEECCLTPGTLLMLCSKELMAAGAIKEVLRSQGNTICLSISIFRNDWDNPGWVHGYEIWMYNHRSASLRIPSHEREKWNGDHVVDIFWSHMTKKKKPYQMTEEFESWYRGIFV